MKVSVFITGLFIFCQPLFSQKDLTTTTKAAPNLEITDIALADQNGNMVIEAHETCELRFILKNSNDAPAKNVRIKLSHLTPELFNIKYKKSRSLLIVKANSTRVISIPILAGEYIPEGSVEFQIEVLELSGFDAYPAKIEIKTAPGNFQKNAFSKESELGLQLLEDTSTLVIKDFRYTDHNQNDILEAYETSNFQFRLFNLGDNEVKNIYVHIEQIDDNNSSIIYPRSLNLGYYSSYYFQDISIPLEGRKNLSDGLAEFNVYITEEDGLESNHQSVKVRTRKYEGPDLKIVKAEFSSLDGEEIRLNQPINLRLEIKNDGKGTAYKIEAELKLLYDHVQIINAKPKIKIEEIQGGASHEINFQMIANRRYFLPDLPVMLELSADISDFFLDTMLMTSIYFPEEKKIVFSQTALVKQDKEPDTQPEINITAADPVAMPNLKLHSQEFLDPDKNNVINYNESCIIKFIVSNTGSGTAEDVTVHIKQLNSAISGLNFPEITNLGVIGPLQEKEVPIPVTSMGYLPSDVADFKIEVLESRGFDAIPLQFKVKTQKLLEPSLSIINAEFIDEAGQLRRNYPIELRITVENKGPGDASNLKIQFELPNANCWLLDEKASYNLKKLKNGETGDFSLSFITNRRYTEDQIPVKVGISESHRKFGVDTILVGNLNAEVLAIKKHEVQPKIIEHQPEIQSKELRGGGDPLKGLGYEEAVKDMNIGRYFALIIGIDNYSGDWPPLKNAVHDAKAIEEILDSKYKFDHFETLYNDMASGKNILKKLEWLIENVSEDDNLLIFYSGHGDFKENINRGYWVPADAKTTETIDLISNSEIQDYLEAIKSKHTLLISDACFSGDIFRGETVSIPLVRSERYYRQQHAKSSRRAITSGGIEPVVDGGPEGHSVFSYYLLESLETNQERFFDASQLYTELKVPVFNNSNQSPIFLPIKNTGDQGGQFIFIRK